MCVQPIYGSPFYAVLQPGPAAPEHSNVVAIPCAANMTLDADVLQTCMLIRTADEFGNVIQQSRANVSIEVDVADPAAQGLQTAVLQVQDASGAGRSLLCRTL